jgi:hypothetical protein
VSTLGCRDDGGVADQGVVDTRVGDEVGLELVQIDVQGTVETQRRGDGADDLSNESVKVLVGGTGDVEVSAADIVDSLVIDEESAVGVLDGAVGGQDSVVGLDNGGRGTRSRVNGELELALLAVLGSQTLQDEGTKTGAGTTTEGVEDEETLQRVAVVCAMASGSACQVPNRVGHLAMEGPTQMALFETHQQRGERAP